MLCKLTARDDDTSTEGLEERDALNDYLLSGGVASRTIAAYFTVGIFSLFLDEARSNKKRDVLRKAPLRLEWYHRLF